MAALWEWISTVFQIVVAFVTAAGAVGWLATRPWLRRAFQRAFGDPMGRWADRRIVQPLQPELAAIRTALEEIKQGQDLLGQRMSGIEAQVATNTDAIADLRAEHDALANAHQALVERVQKLEDRRAQR